MQLEEDLSRHQSNLSQLGGGAPRIDSNGKMDWSAMVAERMDSATVVGGGGVGARIASVSGWGQSVANMGRAGSTPSGLNHQPSYGDSGREGAEDGGEQLTVAAAAESMLLGLLQLEGDDEEEEEEEWRERAQAGLTEAAQLGSSRSKPAPAASRFAPAPQQPEQSAPETQRQTSNPGRTSNQGKQPGLRNSNKVLPTD
jgi:hypothetical protein